MNLNTTLQKIGLTEKEARIYITLLRLKEALPSIIAKKSEVKRPTTYLILEQLEKKGLCSKVKKGKYSYFHPLTPHALLEDQYNRFRDLELIMPNLLSLHEEFLIKPQVKFFEGEEGLRRIMEDTLTTSTEILCFADVKLATTTLFKDYYPLYIEKKVKNKIWLRGVFCYDKEALKFKKTGKKELREVYLISKKEFPFKNEINIYDDKIAIISHQDKTGVIIQNSNVADTQRSIFNFAFKYAKQNEDNLLTKEDKEFLKN